MKVIKVILFSFFSIGIFALCNCNNSSSVIKQSYTSGIAKILVDESFQPIIEDQVYLFESTYTNAKISLIFKPENEVLDLFLNDSVRVAILSRTLTDKEFKFYENKNIKIHVNRFAIDGIALITNESNPDSTVTVADIVNVMKGKRGKIKSFVFDNPNSSTVRFLKELANVDELPQVGIYALKSNPEVIKYVFNHPGTIGVIGVNWMVQPDPDIEQMVNKLKVIGVKNLPGKPGSDAFYKPSQNDIALGLYPLTRSLYIINGEGGAGLGTGFASFLAGERGQRIVLKSGLLPDSIPSREIIIRK